jgi:hypothetical protein
MVSVRVRHRHPPNYPDSGVQLRRSNYHSCRPQVLRPRRSSPPPLPSKSAVNNKPLSIYPDLLVSTTLLDTRFHLVARQCEKVG